MALNKNVIRRIYPPQIDEPVVKTFIDSALSGLAQSGDTATDFRAALVMAFDGNLNNVHKYSLDDAWKRYAQYSGGLNVDPAVYEWPGCYPGGFPAITWEITDLPLGEAASDPNFTSVTALLDMEGTDGDTSYTDVSDGPVTWTFAATAHIEADQKRYGSTSLFVDGNSDYLVSSNAGTSFDFGTGDFTIEASIRFTSLPSTTGTPMVIVGNDFPSPLRALVLYVTTANKLVWGYSTNGTTKTEVAPASASFVATDTWYDVAVSRVSNVIYLFVDGALVHSEDEGSQDYRDNGAQSMRIGSMPYSNFEYYFNGYIDEVRFTKGVGRWTTTYTPEQFLLS